MDNQERRLQIKTYKEWLRVANGKPWPSLADMDGVAIDTMAIESWRAKSFALRLEGFDSDPEFMFIGDELLQDCDDCDIIERQSQVPSLSLLSRLSDHYLQCVANAAPVGLEATFVNRKGVQLHYRGILLPLSDDGKQIDRVWGTVSSKIAPQEESPTGTGPGDETSAFDTGAGEDAPDDMPITDAKNETEADEALIASLKPRLAQFMNIPGALGAALVDCAKGAVVIAAGSLKGKEIERAALAGCEVLNSRQQAFADSGLDERIEDVLFTLPEQFHLLRPLNLSGASGLAVLVILDKAKANFGMARLKLSEVVNSLTA